MENLPDLYKLFDEINEEIFSKHEFLYPLPYISLDYCGRNKSVGGSFRYYRNREKPPFILVDEKMSIYPNQIKKILAHELLHYFIYLENEDWSDNSPLFIWLRKKLGIIKNCEEIPTREKFETIKAVNELETLFD